MAAKENNTNGEKNGKKKKIIAIAVSAVALCIAVAIVLLLLLRPGEDPGGIVTSGGSGVNGGDIPPGVEDPEEPELPDRPSDEDYEEPVEPETPITPGTVMEAGDRPTLRELLLYDAELTIRLTADVETGSPFTVQGKKTLIGDHSVTYFMDGVPNTYVFTLAADSALTVDGPTVNGNNRASGFFADEGSNFTYLSGSVININAYAVNTFKSEVRIKGGTFDDSGMGTIGISAQSQGYIEGGTFSAGEDATAVAMNGSYLRITGNPVFKRNWGVGNTAMFGAYADSEIDVRGGDYDGGNIASNIFYVNASKLTIKGTESSPIEIYNSGFDGVRAGADGEYNLEYVYFHDIAVAAMRTNDKAKTDVSHCRVENADYGYLVYGVGTVGSVSDVDFENIGMYAVVSYGNASHVTVSDCTVDKAYRAVYITATSFVKNPDGSFDVDRNEIDVRNITCTEVRNPFHAIKRGKLTVHNAKVSGVTEVLCFISEDSEFYCYDSEFFDNHTNGNGGVVWAAAEKVVLSGCTFRDGVCGSDLGGGAIYVKGKTETTVTDCTFRNLTSGNQGGAIYINENARVTTENCTFENTASATSSGGAVYVNTNATYQDGVAGKKDSGSTFTNCHSGTAAGAIKINGKVNLYGSTFTYNTATTGGAIYVEQNAGDVRIEDVTFDHNTGTSGPSAITALNGSTVRMENAVFTNNTANGTGGVCTTLLVQGAKVTGRNCVFTGNVGGTGAYGGAIIVTSVNSKLTLTSDDKTKYKFEGNYTTVANSKGADICVLDAGNADISGYTFSDSKENPCGAAAFNNAGILKISDCDFRDHTVTGNGGVIWCRSGTITAEKCDFTGNSAGGNGGVLYIKSAASMKATDCRFFGNTANIQGGVFYIDHTADDNTNNLGFASVTTEKCTFGGEGGEEPGNSAPKSSGGVAYVKEGTTYRDGIKGNKDNGSAFTNNYAGTIGGVIKVNGAIHLYGSAFKSNYATDGGAVFMEWGTGAVVEVENANFDGNRSTGTSGGTGGGALHLKKSTTPVTITGTTFTGNINEHPKENTGDDLGGGAICVDGAVVNAEDCTFDGNGSTKGGAVATTKNGAPEFNAIDCGFAGNYTTSAGGGAIFAEAGTVKLTGSSADDKPEIKGNTSGSTAGGVAVFAKATVTVKNYTFDGNKTNETNGGGGAFTVNGGKLTLEGCTVRNHDAAVQGGALWASDSGAVITFTDTDFIGNRANVGKADLGGGVMYIKNGVKLTATGCEFTGNSVVIEGSGNGGGVMFITADAGKASPEAAFTNCEFTGNKSPHWGGVFCLKANTSVEAVNCTFGGDAAELGNSAVSGGAILTRGGTVKLTGGTVRNNQAVGAGNGGALWADGGAEITIDGTDFIENKANTTDGNLGGGAMYIIGGAQLTAANCEFTGNSVVKAKAEGAVNGGGVLYIKETGTAASFDNCTFKKNTSAHWGGVFYIQDATAVTTKNCTFGGDAEADGNSAAAAGGAVYVIKGATYTDGTAGSAADGSTFKFNHSDDAGGAIKASTTVNLYGTAFASNSSKNTGGAVLVDAATAMKADDCAFTGNTSGQGGAINIQGTASVATERCTFGGGSTESGNSAISIQDGVNKGSGGAIYVNNDASYQDGIAGDKTAGSAFQFNNAANGGAIKVNGKIYIYGSTFRSNSATDGGAVFMEWTPGAVVILQDAAFDVNTSTGPAGALHLKKSTTPVAITGTTFTGNTSGGNGGAICIEGAVVTGTNVSFTGNTANGPDGGGAIFIGDHNDGKLTLNNDPAGAVESKFEGNTAVKYGGAVFVKKRTVEINGYTVADNTAAAGGAVILYGADVKLTDCTVRNSQVTGQGGAVWASDDGAVITLEGTDFVENKANTEKGDLGGGALYIKNGVKLTATGCEFTGNAVVKAEPKDAKNGGGVMYITVESGKTAPSAEFTDCTFNKNTSAHWAGVFFINTNTSITTKNCTFGGDAEELGNRAAAPGGAIYVSDRASYIDGTAGSTEDGSTFKFNHSDDVGGAIKVNGKIYIYGSEFSSNSAKDGGGVFMEWGKDAVVELKDAAFVGNTSTGPAGALHLKKSTTAVTITGTTFTGNTSGGHGGAVFIEGVAVNVNECDFEGNTAKGNGGALAVNNDTGTVTVHLYGKTDGGNSVIDGNTAAKGGSVAVFGTNGNVPSTVDIKNYTFTGNKGTEGYAEGFMEKGTATADGTVTGWKQDQ